MTQPVDDGFYARADAHIQLSNQQISEAAGRGKVSASMMFATARFNTWVSACEYAEGMGYVKLYFTSRIAPHLLQLKGKFTSYKLAQANALRSIYSWRLLELLSQFKSTGWRQIPIAEFCHAMEATEKQRNDFAAIRRKIIEPAVKELIEKDGWLIEWQPIKEGRKVAAIRFEFRRDPQGRLDL